MHLKTPLKSLTSLAVVALFAGTSVAAQSSAPTGQPLGTKDRVIWDNWYTVTVTQGQKKLPYQSYNERVELKKGRVFIQHDLKKYEEGYINEEQLGTFSLNDPELTPLFYNFRSKYRASETRIDGTVKDNRQLIVSGMKAGSPFPAVKKVISKHTIFAQAFPVWLGVAMSMNAGMQEGQSLPFTAIPEDRIDTGFAPAQGTARLEKLDDFATRSKTRKFTVNYQNQKSTWYVDPTGAAARIEVGSPPIMVVERVSKAQAQGFLKE